MRPHKNKVTWNASFYSGFCFCLVIDGFGVLGPGQIDTKCSGDDSCQMFSSGTLEFVELQQLLFLLQVLFYGSSVAPVQPLGGPLAAPRRPLVGPRGPSLARSPFCGPSSASSFYFLGALRIQLWRWSTNALGTSNTF